MPTRYDRLQIDLSVRSTSVIVRQLGREENNHPVIALFIVIRHNGLGCLI